VYHGVEPSATRRTRPLPALSPWISLSAARRERPAVIRTEESPFTRAPPPPAPAPPAPPALLPPAPARSPGMRRQSATQHRRFSNAARRGRALSSAGQRRDRMSIRRPRRASSPHRGPSVSPAPLPLSRGPRGEPRIEGICNFTSVKRRDRAGRLPRRGIAESRTKLEEPPSAMAGGRK
jgi:hypothetical protein